MQKKISTIFYRASVRNSVLGSFLLASLFAWWWFRACIPLCEYGSQGTTLRLESHQALYADKQAQELAGNLLSSLSVFVGALGWQCVPAATFLMWPLGILIMSSCFCGKNFTH